MIVKITKGKGWQGAHAYIAKKEGASVVCSNLTRLEPKTAALQIAKFRSLRPTLKKAVAHFSLSIPPNDRKLDLSEWEVIAHEFLSEMGFDDCPFAVYRHHDTDHDHIHILTLRINSMGEVISDQHDFRRAELVARRLEQRHQLKTVQNKQEEVATTLNQRRSTMNNPSIENVAEDTNPACSIEFAEPVSERKKRERRRYIVWEGYEPEIRSALGDRVKEIKRFNDAVLIYLNPTGYLRDKGDSIYANSMSDLDAAQAIVDLAFTRGWTTVRFTGSDEFLRCAMRLALTRGLQVIPRDDGQAAILNEVVARMAGAPIIKSTSQASIVHEPVLNLSREDVVERLRRSQNNSSSSRTSNTSLDNKPSSKIFKQ